LNNMNCGSNILDICWTYVNVCHTSLWLYYLCIVVYNLCAFQCSSISPLRVDACSRCHKPLLKFMLSIFLKKLYMLLWRINKCSKMYSIAIIEFKVQSTRFARVIKYMYLSLLKTKWDLSKLNAYLYNHLFKKT
jgi:hypothetical protein